MGWLDHYPPGASLTELEFQQCLQSVDHKHKAFFYFRDPSFIKEIPEEQRGLVVDDGGRRLRSLKAQVRASGSEVFDDYPCQWGGVNDEGQPIIHGLEEFGARVLDNLWNAIVQSRTDHLSSFEESDDEMKSRHTLTSSWVECLRARFRGRRKLLSGCVTAVNQHRTGMMLITGKPGSGKSSLMASLITQWSEHYRSHEACVVVHCVGAYPGSSDVIQMLRYVCVELKEDHSYKAPEDYKSLCLELRDLLKHYSQSESRRMLLFIDGVDHLDNTHNAKSMSWLPELIPKNVLIIVAESINSEVHNILKKRSSLVATKEVGDLEIADRVEMVRGVFEGHAKKLEETAFNNQMRTLIQKRESSSPLYLSLACEEVRKYGNFEQLSKKLGQLPATLARLVAEVLEKAEEDFGKEFVRVLLICLYSSRNGLTEEELCHLTSISMQLSPLSLEDIASFGIIINTISSSSSSSSSFFLLSSTKVLSFLQCIRSLLKPASLTGHIAERAIEIGNTALGACIPARYLSSQATKKLHKSVHLLLAYHFYSEADPQGDKSWTACNCKALSELTYHLLQGQDLEAWEGVMVDWRFVRARFMVGQAKKLMEDYAPHSELPTMTSSIKRTFDGIMEGEAFKDYKAFVLKNCHTLSVHPHLFVQQVLMEDEESSVRIHLTHQSTHQSTQQSIHPSIHSTTNHTTHLSAIQSTHPSSHIPTNQYFLWTNKNEFLDHCLHTVDNIKQVARCMCLNKDNSLLAVGFDDVIIRIFNTDTYQMAGMFIGHSSDVTDLCFVGDNRLCSASKDHTLSLWHVREGYRISVLEGHDRGVSGCVADGVGRVVASVGLDGKVVLWHGGTGCFETTLARERSPINCVAMTSEGRHLIVGLWKGLLHLYDLLERRRIAVFRGHAHSVTCVAFDQSGNFVTSADIDGEVRTWSVKHGCTVSHFKGHSLPITRLSFSHTHLLTASYDALIKVSSGKAGKCVGMVGGIEVETEEGGLEGGGARATCLSINPNSTTSSFCVATGYHQGCVKMHSFYPEGLLWNKQLSATPVAISSIAFLEKGEGRDGWLLVGRVDGSIYLLDPSTGHVGHHFEGATASVTAIATTATMAICGSEDSIIYLFDCSSLAPLNKHGTYKAYLKLSCHEGAVSGVCVSPSQKLFASVGYDMRLVVWSLEVIGQRIHVIENAHADWLTCCAWSNQDDFLVTGSLDFTLKLWEVGAGVEKRSFKGHMASISAVAYQHGCIVSTSTNGDLKVWSHKGVLITSIQSHTQRCNQLGLFFDTHKQTEEECVEEAEKKKEALTDWADMMEEDDEEEDGGDDDGGGGDDGDEDDEREKTAKEEQERAGREEVRAHVMYVVTCSDDASTKLWKPLETEERATLIGHVGGVTSLAVGRGGFVCSGGVDRCLKVWQVAESASGVVEGTADAVVVASNPALSLLCVAYKDGTLDIWNKGQCPDDDDDDDDEYLTSKFKVSDENITAATFCSNNHLMVATADHSLLTLRLLQKRNSLHLELLTSTKTVESISSLSMVVGGLHDGDGGSAVVVATHLSGRLSLWLSQGGAVVKETPSFSLPPIGPQEALIHPASFTTSHSHHGYVVLAGSPSSTAMCFLNRETNDPELFRIVVRLKTTKWVCSVGAGGDDVFLGDCDGKVWVYSEKEAEERAFGMSGKDGAVLKPRIIFKAHRGRVLSMAVVGGLLVTASEDLLIKVWSLQLNQQLGQFVCPSPVVCLRRIGNHDDHLSFSLLCASKAGPTFILKWIY